MLRKIGFGFLGFVVGLIVGVVLLKLILSFSSTLSFLFMFLDDDIGFAIFAPFLIMFTYFGVLVANKEIDSKKKKKIIAISLGMYIAIIAALIAFVFSYYDGGDETAKESVPKQQSKNVEQKEDSFLVENSQTNIHDNCNHKYLFTPGTPLKKKEFTARKLPTFFQEQGFKYEVDVQKAFGKSALSNKPVMLFIVGDNLYTKRFVNETLSQEKHILDNYTLLVLDAYDPDAVKISSRLFTPMTILFSKKTPKALLIGYVDRKDFMEFIDDYKAIVKEEAKENEEW